jgi:membrane protein
MYKILPRAKIGWRDVWIGAAVTALLFTIGKFGLGFYIGGSDVASSFGAAGSFVIVLLWVYYSAQIFLLGAEFTWVYAHALGSRRGQDRPSTAKHVVSADAGNADAKLQEVAIDQRAGHADRHSDWSAHPPSVAVTRSLPVGP